LIVEAKINQLHAQKQARNDAKTARFSAKSEKSKHSTPIPRTSNPRRCLQISGCKPRQRVFIRAGQILPRRPLKPAHACF